MDFHSYREPFVGVDKMRKAEKNNYMVVMRRGHFFKVSLNEKGINVSIPSLIAIFEAILYKHLRDNPLVAALTADDRDRWTVVRDIVKKADRQNEILTSMIEAAAFIVCLDEASPETSTSRANQCM